MLSSLFGLVFGIILALAGVWVGWFLALGSAPTVGAIVGRVRVLLGKDDAP